MGFEVVETLQLSGRGGLPASVGLRGGKGGRPACNIGLTAAFCAVMGLKESDRFNVLLGSGSHKRFLRLVRTAGGPAKPKFMKGGCTFNLGYIEKYGTEPEEKQFCDAQMVDPDTIEITLPSWSSEIED